MERRITLDQISLRLLAAFVAVYDHQHVSRAADSLGISQPTLSSMLSELRRLAGDPLFLRSGRGVQPSALAMAWIGPIRLALNSLEQTLNGRSCFDPRTSSRRFVVYMSDAGQHVILQRMLATMAMQAPQIRLQIVSAWTGAISDRLGDGTLDLALGWIPQLTSGKSSTTLFRDRYVGVCSSAGARTSPTRYAVALMPPTAHRSVLERLAKHGAQPIVTVPTFQMLAQLLDGTSLTGIVPERLATTLCAGKRPRFRTIELPFALPTMTIRMHWSLRSHDDRGNRWLRAIIQACVDQYLEST